MIDTSRYDAFGDKTGGTGAVANQYLFAGEQYDSNLGDYYLRARYYDTDTGRFTRRDKYEGRLGEPVSLHKYLYAHGNPVNLVDPSGLTPVIFGQAVHDKIGDDFIRLNRAQHLYDQTVAQILTIRLGGYTVGRQGNGRRPDLTDVGNQEIYEIKPNNPRGIISGTNKLLLYLNTLNSQDPGWTGGMSYVPPGLITISQDPNAVYLITPSFGGLILYTRINLRAASTAFNLVLYTTIVAVTAALLAQFLAGGKARSLGF